MFHVEGDRLKVDAPQGVLTPELREELRQHKPAIIALVRSPVDSQYFRDRFEERTAIHEIENGWPAEEAQLWAMREVMHEYFSQYYPSLMEELGKMIFRQSGGLH